MHITIAYNAPTADGAPDEQDVLVQVRAVLAELNRAGHRVNTLTCDLNLEKCVQTLTQDSPDLVFNLVESLAGSGRLIHIFPGLLDVLGLTYTGVSAEAMFLTSNKLLAKTRLRDAGLPTADWVWAAAAGLRHSKGDSLDEAAAQPWIVKSVWEHASIGLDDRSIVQWPGAAAMCGLLRDRSLGLGGSCFAERFIEGREFNLSIVDIAGCPRVLPPAEIIFSNYEAGKRRIVDYQAKWDPASFEYHHTPRHFEFPVQDRRLLDRLTQAALACWHAFELSGYARVDFRVDDRSQPWILEVNANPCLSPDAGFAAAVAQAGLSYEQIIGNIVAAGLKNKGQWNA